MVFCCMWNHRNLKYSSKEIEKIIKSHLPHYNCGDRRYDYKIVKQRIAFKC